MTDEHFIVWMRAAAQSSFRKLWGRINVDLNKGSDYYLVITNNYSYMGKKQFVLSTMSTLGGRDTFLATVYIVMAVFCAIAAIAMCSTDIQIRRNKSTIGYDALKKEGYGWDFNSILRCFRYIRVKLSGKTLIPEGEHRILMRFWSKFVSIDRTFET